MRADSLPDCGGQENDSKENEEPGQLVLEGRPECKRHLLQLSLELLVLLSGHCALGFQESVPLFELLNPLFLAVPADLGRDSVPLSLGLFVLFGHRLNGGGDSGDVSLSVAVSQFGPFPFNLTLPFKNLFPQGNQVHPREGGVVGYFGEEVLHRGAGEVGVVLQVAESLGGKEELN